MGIFILDQIDTTFGLSLNNTYCSIRGSYNIRKRENEYVLSTYVGIWVDKQSYICNKEMIERPIIYEDTLTLEELDNFLKSGVHVYEIIYNRIKIKLGYNNYTDDI
jgi:hypothetical protein